MFRFTIRELVLVTVIVALAVGWWVARDTAAKQRAESNALISSLQQENKGLQSRNAAILKGVYFIGYSAQDTGGGKFEFKRRRDAKP